MKEISSELKNFIYEFCTNNRYKISKAIVYDTYVDFDLGIDDLDIDLFVTDFILKFNIPHPNFSWKKYGYPSLNTLAIVLKFFIPNTQIWLSNSFLLRIYKPKIKVGVFQDALDNGELI